MTLKTTLKKQWRGFSALNPSAKMLNTITVLYGIFFAAWGLFFNFFLLGRGFDRELLGLANSMLSAGILVFGLPMGMVSDRIGRKNSIIIGHTILLAGYFVMLLSKSSPVILAALFFAGLGEALFIVSQTPLLAKLSDQETRSTLFSLNRGLATLSGVAGSYLGGQAPLWLEAAFGIDPGTVLSYQGVMMGSIALTLLAYIPLFMIKEPQGAPNAEAQKKQNIKQNINKLQNILQSKLTWKMLAPNLSIGIGASLMVPYLNLFFVEKFNVSDQMLGTMFSLAALITGSSTLLSPRLADKLGSRIRAIVTAQVTSLFFLLALGFSPWIGLALIGFWGRGALMNMVNPLFEAFSLEQVSEEDQGTFNSLMVISWQIGWVVGPFLSGLVQQHFGFTPIFLATACLYGLASFLMWTFFHQMDRREPAQTPQAVLQSP